MRLLPLFIAGLFILATGVAIAGNQAQHNIILSSEPIYEISVSGTANLVVNTATPGYQPGIAEDLNSVTFSLTTNRNNVKVYGSLNQDIPQGTELLVHFNASNPGYCDASWPQYWTSLDTTPKHVLTVSRCIINSKEIFYNFSVPVSAGTFNIQRTVTYVLTEEQ